jgi:hypothetical protein
MPPTAAAVALSPQTLQSIVKAAVSKALKARAAEENEEGAQETATSPAHVAGMLTDADVCWRMLTYAASPAHVAGMLTDANVC